MSVKTAINVLIPPEWDYVLRKNKVLTVFKEYLYDYSVPYKLRNKRCYKISIARIKHNISCGLTFCFDTYNTKEGYKFWQKIEFEINEYIEQCR